MYFFRLSFQFHFLFADGFTFEFVDEMKSFVVNPQQCMCRVELCQQLEHRQTAKSVCTACVTRR